MNRLLQYFQDNEKDPRIEKVRVMREQLKEEVPRVLETLKSKSECITQVELDNLVEFNIASCILAGATLLFVEHHKRRPTAKEFLELMRHSYQAHRELYERIAGNET